MQKKQGQLVGKIKIILLDFQGQYFFKKYYFAQQIQKKNAKCIIYYNNDKCFLVLVICMSVMLYVFFLQKAENNRLKKASWPKLCNIFLFLLKAGSVGPVDQQINFALPQAFLFKFICTHFYITIIHKGIFFNWNITSSPYLEMLLIKMVKLLFLFFLIDPNVRCCFL